MPTTLDPTDQMQVVRVVNTGKSDFADAYNSRRYTIKAGSEAILPWEVATHWLGNPFVVNLNDRYRPRLEEFSRLEGRYGIYHGLPNAEVGSFPSLEVYDLDGNRVYMTVEDPDAEKLPTGERAQSTYANENEFLRNELLRMQAQQERILQMLAERSTEGPIDVGPTLPPDVDADVDTDADDDLTPHQAPLGPAATSDEPPTVNQKATSSTANASKVRATKDRPSHVRVGGKGHDA